MDMPTEIAGAGIDAIASAKDPEASAGLILDLEIVAHRIGLAVRLPPFAVDSVRAVGLAHDIGPPPPGEPPRRSIRKQSDDLVDLLRPGEQPNRARPVGWPIGGFAERGNAAQAAFGNVAFYGTQSEQAARPEPAGETIDQRRQIPHGRVAT